MKKLFILFFIMASYTAKTQILIALLFGEKLNSGKLEFGLVLGPSFTNITNTESDYRSALTLGMFFNIRPDKKFHIHAELVPKASFGAKNISPYSLENDSLDHLFSTGSVERIIRTMNMSILGRYTVSKHFFIDAGIQPDILYKPRDIFTVSIGDDELQYTKKLDEQFTRLDFQLAGGFFYRFKPDIGGMGLGFRYTRGLTDIDKHAAGTQVNVAWQFHITIPIGAQAKEKSKE